MHSTCNTLSGPCWSLQTGTRLSIYAMLDSIDWRLTFYVCVGIYFSLFVYLYFSLRAARKPFQLPGCFLQALYDVNGK